MKRPPGILLPTLGVLGGLVLVVALAILFLVNRSRTDLAAYKAELEQRGETFDVTRLAPPAPPTENNGADALVAAGIALKATATKNSIKPYKTGQMETTPGQAEILHRRHAALRLNKDTTWEDFHKEMEILRPLLAEIRRCAQAPVLEIQPDYTQGFSMPLPFLTPFLSSGQYLGAESLVLLRDGDTITTAKNIETILRIAEIANKQPILISRMVVASLAGISQTVTWELLQASPSAQDLQRIQKAWESFSIIGGLSEIMRLERASCAPSFSSSVKDLQTIELSTTFSTSASGFGESLSSIEWTIWSVIFRYSDEKHFIANYQDLIARLDGNENHQSILTAARNQKSSLSTTGISRRMSVLGSISITQSLDRIVAQAALQSLTITAIAIRRHQLDHAGQPPNSLADLVPTYLAKMPVDPMTNEPLHYQRKGEHFLLYAVGGNGVDDGSDATTTPPGKRNRGPTEGLDIVWPQAVPPTPETLPGMRPSLNRPSRLLQFLAGAAITSVVLVLILAVIVVISRRNLAAYKEELKNRGEVLDLAAVRVTAPPDAEQRALAFLTIGAEINPLVKTRKFRSMDIPKESPPGKSTILHHRDLTVVSGTIPYSWDEAAVEFMPMEPDLEKIREISEQGPFGIHPDYSLGHAALIVGSDEAMNVAFTLIAQSYLHMRNGKTSEAARNISSALRISAMLSGQRMVVAQAIALGLIEITKKATWDLLQSPSIKETDLRMLQEAWGNVRIAEGLIPAMRFERASGLTAFDASVENGLAAISSGGRPPSFASWQEISSAAKMYLWGALFRSSDQLHYIKAYQAPIDAAPANPLVGPWKNSYEGARHHYLKANDAQISRMLSEILLIREDFITQVVATQAQAALTSTAIALRRHQLAFQTLPETLDELAPQCLPTVPFDPFDGQPLRYRKISDREFLLYSTGTDFEDNGGLATSTSRTKTKDLVWPQPITPAPADSGPDRPRE